MSDLSSIDRRKLESLLRMGSGYVLNFSDRTFSEFFEEHTGIDIDHARYRVRGTSKANRLRAFWAAEPDHLVAKVITAMMEWGVEGRSLPEDPALLDDARRIVVRLSQSSPVAEIESLSATANEKDFEAAAKQIRQAIDKNQPEAALDRLHVFAMKFMRTVCEAHGVKVTRDKPLHSMVGEYVRRLREGGYLESEMTERILKSSISTLEAFNSVRNNQSLAHDNPILNYNEALLIFNHVASSIRFIKVLEGRLHPIAQTGAKQPDGQIPP
jgi:Abortive infection C-terminus